MGLNKMHLRILRKLADRVLPSYLSMLTQKAWQSGEVRDDWKKGKLNKNIAPIFKKGGKEGPENYQTVSFTSVPGKIIEQLILEAVLRDMEEIQDSQHSFTEGKSCLTNAVAFVKLFKNSLKNIMIFLL